MTAAVLLAAMLAVTARHPIHTSVVSLVQPASSAPVEITVRLFADDLARAVGRPPEHPEAVTDGECLDYVSRHFALRTGDGRVTVLRWKGRRQDGAAEELRFEAEPGAALAGVTVESHLLSEIYADQLNLVRGSYAGRSVTLLFLRHDSGKRLP